jgi:hypothetical protein
LRALLLLCCCLASTSAADAHKQVFTTTDISAYASKHPVPAISTACSWSAAADPTAEGACYLYSQLTAPGPHTTLPLTHALTAHTLVMSNREQCCTLRCAHKLINPLAHTLTDQPTLWQQTATHWAADTRKSCCYQVTHPTQEPNHHLPDLR